MPERKLLLLGGSHFQVPMILAAKAMGLYVITCDYLPDNPGHKFADEYHNVSTTDLDSVLDLARRLQVDALISYASDVSMQAAAYAAEHLGLPGNSYDSVKKLGLKHYFRKLQRDLGCHSPFALDFDDFGAYISGLNRFHLPVMVKPIDSSGSKGVTRLDDLTAARLAYDEAMHFSLRKRVIVEEFIQKIGPQIHGDGFVCNGKLTFTCLGDHRFANVNNRYTPIATTIPTQHDPSIVRRILDDTQKVISAAGYANGPINIEAMVDEQGFVNVMEIGPRNGGNYVPQLVQYASGANMVDWNLRLALGDRLQDHEFEGFTVDGFYSHYIVHSTETGHLASIDFSDDIKQRSLSCRCFKKRGDIVDVFTGSHCTIGVIILKYRGREDMETILNNIDQHVRIRFA